MHDDHPAVRLEVARQGCGLSTLCRDSDEAVRDIASYLIDEQIEQKI